MLCCAEGELWEKSGQATGKPGDAHVPGKVAMPQEAGKIVQLSTGGCCAAGTDTLLLACQFACFPPLQLLVCSHVAHCLLPVQATATPAR